MIRRILAGLLAGVLMISGTGCQKRAANQTAEDAQYQVVENREASDPPHASEYPDINSSLLPDGALSQTSTLPSVKVAAPEEVRAVWISYLEMAHLLKNKTEKQFAANVGAAFDNIKGFGLNTVIVQVRPFGDALYRSDYFPWSYTITGTEGQDPGFDPLQVMVDQAKARGLRIEAWVNPYRVRAKDNNNSLCSANQAKKWMDQGGSAVIRYNGVTSYNPASADARQLIVNGMAEIVANYDVDGVHIDDYFYPTTDAEFDGASYRAYQNSGGKLSLGDWRRQNVEKLIRQIYAAVKKADPDCLFGISPQSSVENNYSQQYLDVKKVAGTNGYCDYICPQIYFGYQNDVQPYRETLEAWSRMVASSDVKLYVGLGAYKIGATDSWAGSGKNEWKSNSNLMARMVADARAADSYQGFVLYRYDSLFKPEAPVKSSVQSEAKNLKRVL